MERSWGAGAVDDFSEYLPLIFFLSVAVGVCPMMTVVVVGK